MQNSQAIQPLIPLEVALAKIGITKKDFEKKRTSLKRRGVSMQGLYYIRKGFYKINYQEFLQNFKN